MSYNSLEHSIFSAIVRIVVIPQILDAEDVPGGATITLQALHPALSEWVSSAKLKYLTGHDIGHKVLQSLSLGLTIEQWPVLSMRLQSSGELAAAVRERFASVDRPRVLRSRTKRKLGA